MLDVHQGDLSHILWVYPNLEGYWQDVKKEIKTNLGYQVKLRPNQILKKENIFNLLLVSKKNYYNPLVVTTTPKHKTTATKGK